MRLTATLFGLFLISTVCQAQEPKFYTSLADTSINFAEVTHVDFSHQDLSAFPAELMECTNLKHLLLNDNNLTVLPDEFGTLSKLEVLNLDNNKLTGLPKNFGNLKELKTLFLNNAIDPRSLNTVFGLLAKNTKLETLELKENKITAIPTGIKSFKALKNLELSKNNLGTLPNVFAKIPTLVYIGLSYNPQLDFSTAFSYLSQIKTLNHVDISNNKLKAVPKEVMDVRYMASLDISFNEITEIPDRMTQLIRMRHLNAENNAITSISEAFPLLERLEILKFDNNKISTLPANIGDIADLKILDLHNNGITALPEGMRKLKNLENLDLSHNLFEKFTFNISNLSALKHLDLNDTHLKEINAEHLSKLSNLDYLDLSGNVGLNWDVIEPAIGKLPALETLKITHVELKSIEPHLSDAPILKDLDLSYNKDLIESEGFWKAIASFKGLTKLNLSDNEATALPDDFRLCKNLTHIDFSKNKIADLTEAVLDLENLQSLNLSETTIQTLPKGLEKLSKLEKISFANCTTLNLEDLFNALQNVKLQELDLTNCGITALPENMSTLSVQKIILTGNQVAPADLTKLREKLQGCKIILQ